MTGWFYLFIAASVGIITISRASLSSPRSHGFYRFFAWELILLLFVLNGRYWFRNPFSASQIISWLLLVVSILPLVLGVRLLLQRGRPDSLRNDGPLLGMERTTTLVTEGLYSFIRHPLYSSLLLLNWGIFFKDLSWMGLVIALAVTGLLVATAKIEEAENRHFFGAAYVDYMRRTKMFIPFLF